MTTERAIAALAALAQDTRLAIFRLLVQAGPAGLSVGRIGEATAVAPATLSFHLRTLALGGLVSTRQAGRFIYYAADYEAMATLVGYLSENCCGSAGGGCRAEPAATRAPGAGRIQGAKRVPSATAARRPRPTTNRKRS